MKPKSKITNTGELREFLATMMVGVKDGVVDVSKASQITKLAGQLNESLYAEVKTARLQIDLGKAAADIGTLAIGVKMTIFSWSKEITPSDFFEGVERSFCSSSWDFVEYIKPEHTTKVHYYAKFTWLKECEKCKKLSTPKKIKNWFVWSGEYWGRNQPHYHYVTLCWSCYNKIAPMERKFREAHDMKAFVSRTLREIRKAKK